MARLASGGPRCSRRRGRWSCRPAAASSRALTRYRLPLPLPLPLPAALLLTLHLLCSAQGKSWRKLDCSHAGILGNCATVSHMSLRGRNLHNQLKHLEGYVLSPSTIAKSNEHAIMVKKYTSMDGVKWKQLAHAAILINASQLERAVCTVRTVLC